MLRHLAYGWRNFVREPDHSPRRLNWEFFAIIKGRCAPHFQGNEKPQLRHSTLWLLPPQSEYLWTSHDRPCLRVLFQVASLPQLIMTRLGERPCYEVSITESEGRRILQLAEEIQPFYHHPDETYELHYTHVVSELCLLVLTGEKFSSEVPLHLVPLKRVQKAETYYRENIRIRPTLQTVASDSGVSASQLRRDFQRIRRHPPEAVFRSLRLDEACRLLLNTTLSNEDIARETGFGSTVDFHRAFKTRFGATPHHWRTHTKPPEPKFGFNAAQAPSGSTLAEPHTLSPATR